MRTSGALSYKPLDTLLITVTDYNRAVGSPDIPFYLYITDICLHRGTNLINLNSWRSHILLIDWLVQSNGYFMMIFHFLQANFNRNKIGHFFHTSMLVGLKWVRIFQTLLNRVCFPQVLHKLLKGFRQSLH